MSETLNFNPGKKSWRMYVNELTSISGDNLTIKPNIGNDLILEASGNGSILFKKDGITTNSSSLIRDASFNYFLDNNFTNVTLKTNNNVDNLSFTKFDNSNNLSLFASIIYFKDKFIAFTKYGQIKYGPSIENINSNTLTITSNLQNPATPIIFQFNNIIYVAYETAENESINYTKYSYDGIIWYTINYDTDDTTTTHSAWVSYIIDNNDAYFTHYDSELLNVSNVSQPIINSTSTISSDTLLSIAASIYIITLDIYIFHSLDDYGSIYYGSDYTSLTQSSTNLGYISDFAYGTIDNSTVIIGVGPTNTGGGVSGTRVKYSYDGYTFQDAVGVNNDNKFNKVIFIEELKVFIASSKETFKASEGDGNGDDDKNMIYSYDGINWNKITIGYLENIYWYKNNNTGYILGINSAGDIFKSQDFNFENNTLLNFSTLEISMNLQTNNIRSISGEDLILHSTGNVKIDASEKIEFQSDNQTKMILYNDKLGIGTTNPSEILEVSGNLKVVNGNIEGNGHLKVDSHFHINTDTADSANRLHVENKTNQYMRYTNTGNLEVHAPENASGKIVRLGSYNNNVGVYSESDLNLISNNTNPIKFSHGGSEFMRINSNGNVGIGTNNPTQKLHVDGRFYNNVISSTKKSSYYSKEYDITLQITDSNNTIESKFSVHQNGGIYYTGILINQSDDRIKSYEEPLTNTIDLMKKMKPKHYKKHSTLILDEDNETPDLTGVPWKYEYGFIAQELESDPVLSHFVTTHSETGIKHVNYIEMIPLLCSSIKELNNTVEKQQETIDSLILRLEALEKNN